MIGPARLAEGDRVQPQEQGANSDQKPEHQGKGEQRLARKGRAHHQELAEKMPSGGSPAMATTPSTNPQPSTGLVSVSLAPDVGLALRRAAEQQAAVAGVEVWPGDALLPSSSIRKSPL